jgi:hypothetical protein
LIRHYIACGPLVLGKGLIAGNCRAGTLRQQVLSTLQLDCSQSLRSFAPLQGAFGLLNGCLVFAFLNVVQVIAFLDRIALLKENRFKIAFHSGLNLNTINRVYATNKVARLRNLLPLRIDSADWRLVLSIRGNDAQPHQQ